MLRILLQEIYEVQDCWYYNTTEYSSNSPTTLNISLPSTYTVDFDIKPTSRSSASSYVEIGTNTNNCLVIGQITSGGVSGIWVRTNNSYSSTNPVTSNTVLNDWNSVHFEFDGTTCTYTLNGETVTCSKPSYDLATLLRVYPQSNNHLKNIKVKAL